MQGIILVNLTVLSLAVISVVLMARQLFYLKGPLKQGVTLVATGYGLIVAEHIVIAYLRRSGTPLENSLWFAPLPFFAAAVVLMTLGGYKINQVLEKVASE